MKVEKLPPPKVPQADALNPAVRDGAHQDDALTPKQRAEIRRRRTFSDRDAALDALEWYFKGDGDKVRECCTYGKDGRHATLQDALVKLRRKVENGDFPDFIGKLAQSYKNNVSPEPYAHSKQPAGRTESLILDYLRETNPKLAEKDKEYSLNFGRALGDSSRAPSPSADYFERSAQSNGRWVKNTWVPGSQEQYMDFQKSNGRMQAYGDVMGSEARPSTPQERGGYTALKHPEWFGSGPEAINLKNVAEALNGRTPTAREERLSSLFSLFSASPKPPVNLSDPFARLRDESGRLNLDGLPKHELAKHVDASRRGNWANYVKSALSYGEYFSAYSLLNAHLRTPPRVYFSDTLAGYDRRTEVLRANLAVAQKAYKEVNAQYVRLNADFETLARAAHGPRWKDALARQTAAKGSERTAAR